MFEVESQCPECRHKTKVPCESLEEMIKGTKRDVGISVEGLTKEEALTATRVRDVTCKVCSEKYTLVESENWDEIEKIVKKNL